MIVYLGEIKLRAYKVRKPLMDKNRGRVWVIGNIFIDKKPVSCNYDSKYGTSIYFEYNFIQYRLTMSAEYYDDIQKKVSSYSFNPSTEEVHLSTNNFAINNKQSVILRSVDNRKYTP